MPSAKKLQHIVGEIPVAGGRVKKICLYKKLYISLRDKMVHYAYNNYL